MNPPIRNKDMKKEDFEEFIKKDRKPTVVTPVTQREVDLHNWKHLT